jgi:glycosyltransferase involved in cell wall biosynthesis
MTEIKGLVSISIPFYNSERFLTEAIESVLAQTYANWELLLVDDGSSDSSPEIASSYSTRFPERIFCLEHPGRENRGAAATRNRGASQSKGQFLAFLDSDDAWTPRKLEENVALMGANPEAGLLFGRTEYWYDWNPNLSGRQENYTPDLAPAGRLYRPPELLALSYPLGKCGSPCPSSFFVRRTAFDVTGGFEESFNPRAHEFYEDVAFLVKNYISVPVFVSSFCLDKYRCHPYSITQKIERSQSGEAERRYFFAWLKRYLRQNKIEQPEVWRAVRRESWFYSLPIPNATVGLIRRLQNRLQNTLRSKPADGSK